MGTTLTEMQAGSTGSVFVAAIEGYEHLLTSHNSSSAVLTAWSGSDWSSALLGLYVDVQNEQRAEPWDAFANSGGSCTLTVHPDANDTFGIDTHCKSAGESTVLTADATATDTTITVADTSSFGSSGSFYIGTEHIAYSGKTSTTFTGCTRGKYSPFGAGATTRFGEFHRIGRTHSGPKIEPTITQIPRSWLGRWIGVWAHRVVAGVLDVKAQAQLVFAGRIAEIRDDPGSLGTVVRCSHSLQYLKDAVIWREPWSAKIPEGVYLALGDRFKLRDTTDTTTGPYLTATDLVVRASGATPPYEINAGYYTLSDLCSVINAWFTQAKTDSDINGDYIMSSPFYPSSGGVFTRIAWTISTGADARFYLFVPTNVAVMLGFNADPDVAGSSYLITAQDTGSTQHRKYSPNPPLRALLIRYGGTGAGRFSFENEIGVFFDNTPYLPQGWNNGSATSGVGVFQVNGKYTFIGERTGSEIRIIGEAPIAKIDISGGQSISDQAFEIPLDDASDFFEIKQIVAISDTVERILNFLTYSTGVDGYNDTDRDKFPYGMGVGIPAALMSSMIAAVSGLSSAKSTILVIMAKPTKLIDLLGADLVLRWIFPRWKNGSLEFKSWGSPVAGSSVASLTEATKSAPAGNQTNHLTATTLTKQFQKAIVKIAFNRETGSGLENESYKDTFTIEDCVSVDEAGSSVPTGTIKARNTYAAIAATGAGLEALLPDFLAMMPLFSRPARWMTRSIDPRYFEGYSVGDIVLVTDPFARDPSTGQRGMVARPAFVTRHAYSLGGWTPESREASAPVGEVDLFFIDIDRHQVYGPGATLFSYNAGTSTITCDAHGCSESSEAADATHFSAGRKIRIIERDPADPAAPVMWDRTVASQTSNNIVLTSGLSSPSFDPDLFYRVMFDDYADSTADQQANFTYQADDADKKISDLSAPFEYAVGNLDGTATAASVSDEVELPANVTFSEGSSRDCGHDLALARLLNNLMDVKTAYKAPQLSSTVMSGAAVSGTWLLVTAYPVFAGKIRPSYGYQREFKVAPFFRSSDGASASVRVTLCSTPPSSDSLNDHPLPAFSSSRTFTTTSTTWATGTSQEVRTIYADGAGVLWVWIECTVKAQTRGLSIMSEGQRFVY